MSKITGIELPRMFGVDKGQEQAGLQILGAVSLLRVIDEMPPELRGEIKQGVAAAGGYKIAYLGALAGEINGQSTDRVARLVANHPGANPFVHGIKTYAYGLQAVTKNVVGRQLVDERVRALLVDYAREGISLPKAAQFALARVESQTRSDVRDIDEYARELARPGSRPDVAPGESSGDEAQPWFALAVHDTAPDEPADVRAKEPWARFAYGTSLTAVAIGRALQVVADIPAGS